MGPSETGNEVLLETGNLLLGTTLGGSMRCLKSCEVDSSCKVMGDRFLPGKRRRGYGFTGSKTGLGSKSRSETGGHFEKQDTHKSGVKEAR